MEPEFPKLIKDEERAGMSLGDALQIVVGGAPGRGSSLSWNRWPSQVPARLCTFIVRTKASTSLKGR
jgi:hypothetical protein